MNGNSTFWARFQVLCWHNGALLLYGIWGLGSGLVAAEGETPASRFFEEHVHPILAKRCYECHGAEKQESGLRLDSRAAILQGGDSERPGAVSGDPDKSLLMEVIRYDGEIKMPPDEKLPEAEMAVLAEWVASGLPWTAEGKGEVILTMEERAERARREHWSFQPVQVPPIPTLRNTAWPATPLDTFILSQLERAGLTPSPSADRRTLIRRLSFDLWGIPPSPEEVTEFLDDASPLAYQKLVDRWLASPRYGERWGRHWLDVARYADTRGYAFANDRRYPYAYTYRDYVIAAFNSDKPYNEFVVEQLAADQLPIGNDKQRLAAMGFLTTGRKFNNRHDDLDDQIDVVSRGLLGLTVACSRCHDHKYDAVPIEDYYSLYGVFASSTEPEDLPLVAEPVRNEQYEAFQKELTQRRAELESLRKQKHEEFLQQSREMVAVYLGRLVDERPVSEKVPAVALASNDVRPKLLDRWRAYVHLHANSQDPVFGPWSELAAVRNSQFGERSAVILAKWQEVPAGTQPGQINPLVLASLLKQPLSSKLDVAQRYGEVLVQVFQQWHRAGGNSEAFSKLTAEEGQLAAVIAGKDSPTDIPVADIEGYVNRADRNRLRELEKKIQSFQATSPAAPPRAMVLQEQERPHDPRVFLRGNAARLGKPVPRQFLLVVAGPERRPFQQRSGRLELAQSIVDPANPLTRRVIANRVWMHHFGQSLVRTPSDFGIRCDPPVQGELLDYLAARLLENGWSLKSLHREILLSSTYRQASEYRSEAADHDPENRWLWRMNRRRLEFEPMRDAILSVAGELDSAMGGRPVDLFKPPFATRRTVYGTIDRQDLPNLLRVFDFASPDQSQAERPRTSVPQQALYLMNSPFVLEQARQLAARPECGASDVEARIKGLYQIVLQREPSISEVDKACDFIEDVGQSTEQSGLSPWEQFAQLLLLTNEFAYVD